MTKYRVHLRATATTAFDVEAESKEDAINQAESMAPMSLCHHCAGEMDLGDFEAGTGEGDVVEIPS